MERNSILAGDTLLLRGAALWLLTALLLAWCMVGLGFDVAVLKTLFQGKFSRLLQAHLDFLLMSALLFGFYAAKVTLPRHVRWAMVVGAFTNSSLFLLQAVFPALETPFSAEGLFPAAFRVYLILSIIVTSYGFGRGAAIILSKTG
ncbi:MAG: hypothetical protein ACU837_17345 [Gammaproteobacteria bacterium]